MQTMTKPSVEAVAPHRRRRRVWLWIALGAVAALIALVTVVWRADDGDPVRSLADQYVDVVASQTTTEADMPEPAPADGQLFREADPVTVARVDAFIAAYNESQGALAVFWDPWDEDTHLWADNAWMRPNRLNPADTPGSDVTRISPVVQLGKLQSTTVLGQEPAPAIAAFKVSFGGFRVTWVVEFSADGPRVVNVWVP